MRNPLNIIKSGKNFSGFFSLGRKWGSLFLILAVLASLSGCQLVTTAVYMIKGTDVDPDCPVKLKGKIAVLCWTDPSQVYTDGDNANALGAAINHKLNQKLNKKKCEIVSQQEVLNRLDNYSDNITDVDDLIEIAKELEVDYLIGVYLTEYEYQEGFNVFRGKAMVEVSLIDGKAGKEVYSKLDMPKYVYPPNRSVSTDDMSAQAFQRVYMSKLAEQVGRLFYKYDRYDVDM